jgi:uncharacterized protein
MIQFLTPALQPLFGGLLIGLASWLLLASLGRVAGISGITAAALAPNKDEANDTAWRFVFILGLIVGGWIAYQFITVPAINARPTWLLIAAGLIVGFGTVLGSGCTSGHGVCGIGRRSFRSITATLTFMVAGFITVFIINRLTGQPML